MNLICRREEMRLISSGYNSVSVYKAQQIVTTNYLLWLVFSAQLFSTPVCWVLNDFEHEKERAFIVSVVANWQPSRTYFRSRIRVYVNARSNSRWWPNHTPPECQLRDRKQFDDSSSLLSRRGLLRELKQWCKKTQTISYLDTAYWKKHLFYVQKHTNKL